jgi:hypothetical protein
MSLQRGRKQRRLWGPIRQTGATNWERGTAQLANGFLMRLLWRALDDLDYWLTQARLWTVDALYDPDPDGPDNHDGIDRQQLEEACRGDTQLSRG